MGKTLLFAAGHPSMGWELWSSEGTESTTRMLSDVRPGSDSSYPHDFVAMNNIVAFVADDAFGNARLWKLDRDSGNTELIGVALERRLMKR